MTQRESEAARATATHGPVLPDFSGARVTVLGLGQFGGGVGVTRYLAARGATVTLTDREPAEKLAK